MLNNNKTQKTSFFENLKQKCVDLHEEIRLSLDIITISEPLKFRQILEAHFWFGPSTYVFVQIIYLLLYNRYTT